MKRRSVRILIAALVALVIGPALIQGPATAATTVKFTGHVYNRAGEPLNDITVTLFRVGQEMDLGSTTTDKTGKFTLPGVPKNNKVKYYIWLQDYSRNYVDKFLERRTFTTSSAQLGNYTLIKAGFITGSVTTKDGEEVNLGTGISVSASNTDNGSGGSAGVGEDGTFTVPGLQAGTYELTFDDYDNHFAGGCYDNLPFDTSGEVLPCVGSQTVTVKPGKTTVINPQVLDNPLETASGTVTDENGDPLSDVWINVWDAEDDTRWYGSTYTDQDGSWTVPIDHAGTIKVRAQDESVEPSTSLWFENAQTWEAATPILLADGGDIGEIDLVLPPR